MLTSRVLMTALAWVCVLTTVGVAQDKRPMTAEDTVSVGTVSEPRVSPDGSQVVFSYSEVDRKANLFSSDLWLVPADGSAPPRRFTTSLGNDTSPQWSPDGRWVAFLSNRPSKRDQEGPPKTQIWLIPAEGGEAQPLTDVNGGVAGASWSGGGFAWAPDGKRIAFASPETPTEDEQKRIKDKWDMVVVDKDIRMNQLWVIDVAARTATQLTRERRDVGDPQWSPDGGEIAFVARPTPTADDGLFSDIVVVPAAGGVGRILTTNPASDFGPRWSPDGKTIAYLCGTMPQSGGQNDVCLVPASGGTPRNLTEKFDRSEGALIWAPEGRSLFFSANIGVNSYLFSVAVDGGAVKPLLGGERVAGPASLSKDGKQLAFTLTDPLRPADVWVVNADGTNLRALTKMNPHVDEFALGATEVVRWKNPAGQDIEGVLVKAVGYQAGSKCPTIVEPHGGPAGTQTTSFRKDWQLLAGRGYCLFAPNFRGSDGYGRVFIEANIGQWGIGDYEDIMSGVDALVARGIADPARLGVEGWSYGGYTTNRIVTKTTRFKAAVSGAGLSNLLSFFGTTDIQRFTTHYMKGKPWESADVYARSSPIVNVANTKTPLLLIHGDDDRRVPVEQAEQMYISLRKLGVETELVRYPREPHGFGEPNHQIDRLQRTADWFDRFMK
jgi:dipeptidyl aminopeptidase/acylaminoacyl peptidase